MSTSKIPPGFIDARQLAEYLGVARSFVYAHADELGVRRLGGKRGGRLRFDLDEALAAFAPASQPEPQRSAPRRRRASEHVGSILRVRA